jgi:hypothetical protein
MTGSGSQTSWDPWTYGRDVETPGDGRDVVGFDVEATDGSIGTIERATYDVGASYVLVDTGPWVFGGKVMIPAGIITRVDHHARKIFVHRGKEEIKDAPLPAQDTGTDSEYRHRLAEYYSMFRY